MLADPVFVFDVLRQLLPTDQLGPLRAAVQRYTAVRSDYAAAVAAAIQAAGFTALNPPISAQPVVPTVEPVKSAAKPRQPPNYSGHNNLLPIPALRIYDLLVKFASNRVPVAVSDVASMSVVGDEDVGCAGARTRRGIRVLALHGLVSLQDDFVSHVPDKTVGYAALSSPAVTLVRLSRLPGGAVKFDNIVDFICNVRGKVGDDAYLRQCRTHVRLITAPEIVRENIHGEHIVRLVTQPLQYPPPVDLVPDELGYIANPAK